MILKGTKVENLIFKPLLYKGVFDGNKKYEEYTEGLASPNINYPSMAKFVECKNKFVLDKDYSIINNGITFKYDKETDIFTCKGITTNTEFYCTLILDSSNLPQIKDLNKFKVSINNALEKCNLNTYIKNYFGFIPNGRNDFETWQENSQDRYAIMIYSNNIEVGTEINESFKVQYEFTEIAFNKKEMMYSPANNIQYINRNNILRIGNSEGKISGTNYANVDFNFLSETKIHIKGRPTASEMRIGGRWSSTTVLITIEKEKEYVLENSLGLQMNVTWVLEDNSISQIAYSNRSKIRFPKSSKVVGLSSIRFVLNTHITYDDDINYYLYDRINVLNIPLGNKPLRKVNNISDKLYINTKTGRVWRENKIGELIFNGSENWLIEDNNKRFGFYRILTNSAMTQNQICNMLGTVRRYVGVQNSFFVEDNNIRLQNDFNLTLDEFKAKLQEINLVVDYELAETEIEELGTLTQEELKQLELFEDYNSISIDNELNPNLDITYLQDTKKYIEKQITKLQSLILEK